MSDKELEIFKLCSQLKELLGDDEAIADLKLLYQRHPEMFKDMADVSHTILNVVSEEPDFIIKKGIKDILAVSKISENRMGDVGIRNEEGTNRIYHANKKRLRDYERLHKSTDGRGVLSPYTQAQSLDGRLVASNISSVDEEIIPDLDNNTKSCIETLEKITQDSRGLLAKLSNKRAATRADNSENDSEQENNTAKPAQKTTIKRLR